MTPKTLKFKPNRGPLEPVTKVYAAKLTLHKDALEVHVHYDFETSIGGLQMTDYMASRALYPRGTFQPCLTICFNIDEPSEQRPVLIIYGHLHNTWLHGEGKEMEAIYEQIKSLGPRAGK